MVKYLEHIPRFYKDQITTDITNSVIALDSTNWNTTKVISIENLGKELKLVIDNENLKELKISQDLIVQNYNNQESFPNTAPMPDIPVRKTFMATDENLLYIWIPTVKRWKRIPLSDWKTI